MRVVNRAKFPAPAAPTVRESLIEGQRIRIRFSARTYLVPLRVVIHHHASSGVTTGTFRDRLRVAAWVFTRDKVAAITYLRQTMGWAAVARVAVLELPTEVDHEREWPTARMTVLNTRGQEIQP